MRRACVCVSVFLRNTRSVVCAYGAGVDVPIDAEYYTEYKPLWAQSVPVE